MSDLRPIEGRSPRRRPRARDALSDEQRAAAAQAIAARGLPFEIMPGTIVSGYSPIRSEIDPVP